jgi:hypothetical protein
VKVSAAWRKGLARRRKHRLAAMNLGFAAEQKLEMAGHREHGAGNDLCTVRRLVV